jgi:hypothetical protein
MPRSPRTCALVFDREIDRITKANRKTAKQKDNSSSSSNLSANSKKKLNWSQKQKTWQNKGH